MSDIFTYCRPEEVGVHPSWVEDYIKEVNRRHKMQHGFVMVRGGKLFADAYWKPFHKDWLHRMYSVSKTFVSAAVGMLADEGKIDIHDPIIKYFPEYDNADLHPLIREMTIRDMLMMSTCHKYNTYNRYHKVWIDTFFKPDNEPDHKAGTEFRYDTSATYTMDVLVERITGKTFLEYLKEKALLELGFSKDAWCVEAPEGYAWGGSGVECTARDLARFAAIFANGGVVNGKRYLSEQYVKEATTAQIDNLSKGAKPDACSGNGYGYQIWMGRDNSFCFLGMGGQLACIVPEKDLIFTCISDTQGDADGYHGFVDIFYDTIVNRIESDTLPNDDAAYARLQTVASGLEVNVPKGEIYSPMLEKIDRTEYKLGENKMGISSFKFEFDGTSSLLTYNTDRGVKLFPLYLGRYADTVFPETHYFGRRIGVPKGEGYRCLNAAVWESENTLLVRTYAIDDYFGNIAARFTFEGDKVSVDMTKTAEWFFDEYIGKAEGEKA
nr:serine hydrolase [Clostridia bacterium]